MVHINPEYLPKENRLQYLTMICNNTKTPIYYSGGIKIVSENTSDLVFKNIVKLDILSCVNIKTIMPDLRYANSVFYIHDDESEFDIGNLEKVDYFSCWVDIDEIKKSVKFVDKNTLIINKKKLIVNEKFSFNHDAISTENYTKIKF